MTVPTMSKSHVQSCNWVFCKNYTLVCSASDLSISEGVQLHTGGRHSSDEQNCQQGKSDWLYSSGHQTKCPGFWGRIKLTLNPNRICMTFVVSNFTGTCISLIHLVAFVGEQIRVSPHSSAWQPLKDVSCSFLALWFTYQQTLCTSSEPWP